MGLVIAFVIAVGVALLVLLQSPRAKGKVGELTVSRYLRKLPEDTYAVFNDLLVHTSRGSSQIDHVVVSQYGIFVIETKHYKGWIFGSDQSEYWQQVIYKNKINFRNPVQQNQSHLFAIGEVCSIQQGVGLHSIIVFSGSGRLKKIVSETPVIYADNLVETILESYTKPVLTLEQVGNIKYILAQKNIVDKKTRKKHIHDVSDKLVLKEHAQRTEVCPKCGAVLVVRKGKFGTFYGCMNYPKCKYTKNHMSR